MASAFSSIPTLDLSLASNTSTRPALISQLRHALLDVGFLYLKNHGVATETISTLIDALPSLFALSDDAKEGVVLHNSPHFLGYSAVGSERTAGAADQREQFEFGTELPDTYVPGRDAPFKWLYGPNQWPSAYAEIRGIVENYIAELTALSESFLVLFEEALGLPSSTLHSYLSPQHRLKLVRYAQAPSSTGGNVQGVGPHKDSSGWWTFLLQASPPPIGGLQALNRAGEWIDVPSIPGTFVVNIGQAFEVVSGGLCPATTHRVESGGWTRYSVPFFQGVRGELSKSDFEVLWPRLRKGVERREVARGIDSAFLRGDVDTWGEWQLRTKIRSHPDVGKQFYGDICERYIN